MEVGRTSVTHKMYLLFHISGLYIIRVSTFSADFVDEYDVVSS